MEKKMFLKASHLTFERSKALRNNPTHSEALLWSYLKQRPFDCKFRRQHPISEYIVDFYCHELSLIIEVDGAVHAENDRIEKDAERQAFLEGKGISFLRFTNDRIEKHSDVVIQEIENYIQRYRTE